MENLFSPPLSESDRRRFARQLILPEIGEEGQLQLRRSSVLCIGAGGLGSSALFYIAASGVGRIGIIDDDIVSESNLQRQILHDESSLGMPKAVNARKRLLSLDSSLSIASHVDRLTEENAVEYLSGYDLVIDASDNFASRFILNRAAVSVGIPMIYGAVEGFIGQLSVFHPAKGTPCYRCMVPHEPSMGGEDDYSPKREIGVIGVTPGVIGSLQATEAIKLLLNIGTPLLGRLLSMDLLQGRSRTIQIRSVECCPDCKKS